MQPEKPPGASRIARSPRFSASLNFAFLFALALALPVAAQTAVTIQSPNLAGAIAGKAPGSAGVTPSGASSYSVPIKLPPGTAGMAPSLSLTYSSQGGEGLIGLGWALNGLSTINRCPANFAVDGFSGRVGLNADDRYCLDGQRLLLVSGTYGAAAEYRTEVDGISRVTSFGSSPSTGPTYWKVETKAGRILTYGNTADSFVEAQGTTTPLLWAVNRVEDRRGNYYAVDYLENTTTGEHYPLQIRYTGNGNVLSPYAAARFEYQATPRPDTITRFVAGSRTTIAKRLAKVSTWINTAGDGSGGTAVDELRLTYSISASSGRSLVDSIALCDGGNNCLPPTTFAWQQRTSAHNNFAAPGSGVWGGPPATFHTAAQSINAALNSVKMVDINGDGRTDLIKSLQDGTWQVCLSTGAGFNCQLWNGPTSASHLTITGDYDGDGRTDLMVPGAPNWTVCLSLGTGFNCQAWPGIYVQPPNSNLGPTFSYLSGDFNGDGRDDVMVRTTLSGIGMRLCLSSGSGVTCSPYTGPGFFDPHITDYMEPENRCVINTHRWSPTMGDFNGDKRIDVLPVAYQDPGCAWFWESDPNNSFSLCTLGASATSCTPVVTGLGTALGFVPSPGSMAGDLNGDGLQDFVLQGLNATLPFSMKVCLSMGNDTAVSCTDYVPPSSGEVAARTVADFDGDGRPDVLQQSHLCQVVNGSLACTPWDVPSHILAAETFPAYADFDGDGKTDLVFYNKGAGTWRVALAAGPAPDLLASVTDGEGHTAQFDYAPLSSGSVYGAGSSLPYPKRSANAGTHVVSQLRSANGVGGWLLTDYQYEANRADVRGRGSLGFEKIRNIDRTKNITTQVTSSQDFPYIGMTLEEKKTHANGTVLSLTSNTLASFSTAGGAVHPYVSGSTVVRKDLNGAALTTQTSSINPAHIDAYGNVLNLTEVIQAGGDTFTTNTANTFELRPATWLVGLLKRSEVTKSSSLVPPPPAGSPIVSANPTSLLFGTVARMRLSAIQTVTISNTGNAATVLNWSIAYTGGSVSIGSFSAVASGTTCVAGGILPAAGGSCVLAMRYTAGCAVGGRNAMLNIQAANVATVPIYMSAATNGGTCN